MFLNWLSLARLLAPRRRGRRGRGGEVPRRGLSDASRNITNIDSNNSGNNSTTNNDSRNIADIGNGSGTNRRSTTPSAQRCADSLCGRPQQLRVYFPL